MTNPIVQTDIADILREIRSDQKEFLKEMRASDKAILDEMRSSNQAILDEMRSSNKTMLEKINHLEVGQARLEEKFEAQEKTLSKLEGSQNKQIWALITLACTAVVSLLAGLGKFIFFPNP